jgi:hypothetical protein
MSHQNGLVVLRPPRKQGGNKRNPEAPALISKQIGEARSLIVLVFRR